MYKEFYELRDEPFSITPDPRFLYDTDQHREALNHLLFGIRQRKGFMCLTGEVGAGKTTICRCLLDEIRSTCHTALILNPLLSETQLLRAIVEEFGLAPRGKDRLSYMRLINDFLLEVNTQGGTAVLIIDEAQDMSTRLLEMARLLSNLETSSQKLLQIILVGQPELSAKLARPELRQLSQRITIWYHLGRMSAHQTEEYLRHRLMIAGGSVEFDRGAVREIYRYSRGTPRLVNAIGDKSLLAGYVHQQRTIDRGLVRMARSELREAC